MSFVSKNSLKLCRWHFFLSKNLILWHILTANISKTVKDTTFNLFLPKTTFSRLYLSKISFKNINRLKSYEFSKVRLFVFDLKNKFSIFGSNKKEFKSTDLNQIFTSCTSKLDLSLTKICLLKTFLLQTLFIFPRGTLFENFPNFLTFFAYCVRTTWPTNTKLSAKFSQVKGTTCQKISKIYLKVFKKSSKNTLFRPQNVQKPWLL